MPHYFRAILAALILIGGLLVPSGDLVLAAPAAVVGSVLIAWEVIRVLPVIHWMILFVPGIFGLLTVHRAYVAPISEYGNEKFGSFVTLTIFSAAAAALIRTDGGFVPFARVWVIFAIWINAASLATGTGTRAAAFGANPIWVGRALAIGLLFTVWLGWTRQMRNRWSIVIGIYLLVGLFASGSRGPLLAAIAGITVLVLASRVSRSKKFSFVFGALLSGLAALQLPFFQQSRIVGLATGELANDTTRNNMWEQSFQLLREELGGVGYGNWSNFVSVPDAFNYPHNLFLEIFVEQGVLIGLLFSLTVLVILVANLRRSKQSTVNLGIAAWIVAEIVHVSVSGDLNARTFFFALSLGAISVLWSFSQTAEDKGSSKYLAELENNAPENSIRKAAKVKSD